MAIIQDSSLGFKHLKCFKVSTIKINYKKQTKIKQWYVKNNNYINKIKCFKEKNTVMQSPDSDSFLICKEYW